MELIEISMPEILNPTTYEVTLIGGDKVEIGDKESVDFKPHVKLNRWDGECFIKVGLQTIEKSVPVIEGDKVKFVGADIEADFYPLEPTTVIAKDKDGKDHQFRQNELSGFEFEVILKKKPLTNKIVLDIETQGLKFYYQPSLTQQEIDDGGIRPDNVVGSYAVYHATKQGHVIGKTNYMAGKAFHIYRPKITDAEGKWIWGELSLDEQAGTLTTTIPQDFLDTAVYPVSTGTTTFGYTGEGSSNGYYINNWLVAGKGVLTEDRTLTKVSLYSASVSGDINVKTCLFTLSGTTLTKSGNASGVQITAPGWNDFTLTDWKAAATYYIAVVAETGSNLYSRYDSGSAGDTQDKSASYSSFPESSYSSVGTQPRLTSLYATYEIVLFKLEGATKDKTGDALGTCECFLFKDNQDNTLTYVGYDQSDGSGNYSFTGIEDNDAQYIVVAWKDNTPHVFDVSDHVLEPVV